MCEASESSSVRIKTVLFPARGGGVQTEPVAQGVTGGGPIFEDGRLARLVLARASSERSETDRGGDHGRGLAANARRWAEGVGGTTMRIP